MAKKSENAPIAAVPNDDYKAENDARILLDAAEIRVDEERYANAQRILQKKKKAIMSIQDIKDKKAEMDAEESDDSSDDDSED